MTAVLKRVRAWGCGAASVVRRMLLVVFIVAMAVLPLPVVPFVAFLVKPRRREDRTAEVLRTRAPTR